MKYCAYCGAKNKTSAEACRSCGADKFRFVCENCGAEFEKAQYCPACGVKAGRAARTCPECGERYFSRACPECGYTHIPSHATHATCYMQPERSRKKVTVWTVLLWLCLWPIMATIAIWESGWQPKIKIGSIIALWLFCLIFGAAGGTEASPQENPIPTPESLSRSVVIASGDNHDTLAANPGSDAHKHKQEALPESAPSPMPTEQPTPTPAPTEPLLSLEPVQGKAGYVDAGELNLRAAPESDADIIETYEYGQTVEILEDAGEWCRVSIGGVVGYMADDYVSSGSAPRRSGSGSGTSYDVNPPDPETTVDSDGNTVYITNTGEKYHNAWCRYLEESQITVGLEEALSMGYTACGHCGG